MSIDRVVAEGVGFQVGKSAILRDMSFRIQKGETVAVVGHNGAGKTTLFHLLLGLKFRTSGLLTVDGMDVVKPEARTAVGFVPERPYLNLDLSFRKCLGFLGQLSGIKPAQRDARIEELANEFELSHAIDRPLKTYSKGMLQKTLLAQSVLHRPDFLILDEPMSGLDPEARAFLKNRMFKWKSEGRTLLFSSHALEDARELADRVLVIKEGVVSFFGPAKDWSSS